jgi:hypothetical protein
MNRADLWRPKPRLLDTVVGILLFLDKPKFVTQTQRNCLSAAEDFIPFWISDLNAPRPSYIMTGKHEKIVKSCWRF